MELILRGRYLPVGLLGKGGFGTAFLARDFDSPTQRKCVVKLFQPPVTLTPQQLATAQRLFAKEAIVLERLGLQHPQIPNLYAYFPLLVTNPLNNQSEELFYLVQEFIDGDDLEKILDKQGKFSEDDVIKVLRAMLDVLGFVHRNGAIHRDVKPSNIMQGKDGKLSLLDFGAVKEVTASTGVQKGPTTICSPEYAPPEQIMNGTVDQTSDLYALAATCVVLLTDKGSNELRDSISNRWKWQSHAQVSPALTDILERMLQPNPRDRFSTASEVLSALRLIVQTPLSAATPATAAPLITPPLTQPTAQPLQPRPKPKSAKNPNRTPATAISNPTPPPAPPQVQQATQPLSMVRFLGNAAFSGVQGGLLAIATASIIEAASIAIGAWVVMVAGLGFLQFRRIIEGLDLVIIAAVTMAIVIFFRPLHGVLTTPSMGLIIVIALMAGCGMVMVAIVFRLIFRLISEIM